MQESLHIETGKNPHLCILGEGVRKAGFKFEYHPSWMGSVYSITSRALGAILKFEDCHLRVNHAMEPQKVWNMVDSTGATIARIFAKEVTQ